MGGKMANMKADYKTVLLGDVANAVLALGEKPEDIYEYKLLKLSAPCCEKMEDALDKGAIGFGEFHDTILNRDHNINFADCSPYPEGAVWEEYPISFCPFCGEKVEIEEIERVSLRIKKRRIPARTEETYEEITIQGGDR